MRITRPCLDITPFRIIDYKYALVHVSSRIYKTNFYNPSLINIKTGQINTQISSFINEGTGMGSKIPQRLYNFVYDFTFACWYIYFDS